ncbi:two-component system sensor histidine kinase RcsC [Xenorhabdus bovienii]|uniref:two-component system sensor histidine kinase RcsC n=1 Tax=Xenorhabdus bovienii TaxID=40576 RepID=UPI00237D0322|nr:two-component system sensor histidine kinase RcsC [Xenorhabdus bovienii]MDE1482804.1 two-component system sensor histidine kinase RcsC [Xenorhabdus bovienii]MDE9442104.1 two-component system sensor histidine kinase RcsC [Xenorhabdus bovienii]
MRYLSSFRTSLKISRYLFRVLGFMLWALGALLTSFYLVNIFNEVKSDIRQEYNTNYDTMFSYIRHTTNTLRDIQYMTEKHLSQKNEKDLTITLPYNNPAFSYTPLNMNSDCDLLRKSTHNYLDSLNNLILFWKDNIAAPRGLNQIFLVGTQSMCMVSFSVRSTITEPETLKKMVYENFRKLIILKEQGKERNVFWVMPNTRADSGTFYILAPIYTHGQMTAVIGIEQAIRLDSFLQTRNRPISITMLNHYNQPELYYPVKNDNKLRHADYNIQTPYFGYDEGYTNLLLKRRLAPSSFNVIFSLPLKNIYGEFKVTIINSIVLNLISAILIIFFVWLFERKIFAPAEDNAIRLEEHEQFNHKIVASAPVGISILRINDGANILSNELAHNYTRMLTYEDQKRIVDIICDKTSSYIDVVTSNNNHLQISFVHSRYRNEEVAICVLVDISTRVKMEQSLQEMASAAEQANQAKSMFLATVSHELRTPLYGIIGNLELLQSHTLPLESARLLSAMDNASSLLLKIISDILDFSKIESKQLKIDSKKFSCKEIVLHVISNYLPLIVKKELGLYCYIEPNIPDIINNDPVRLQQIISNLLNNAIKFTETGCVVITISVKHSYLYISIKDTGFGIEDKLQTQLFEPFFQINANKQSFSQGTGLGLAICEKLINLMDGDIEFVSQQHIGSIFSIRLPLYGAKYHTKAYSKNRTQQKIVLAVRNDYLEKYLQNFLTKNYFQIALYDKNKIDGTELVIIDQPDVLDITVRYYIEISEKHIGPPKQIREHYWLHNTYQLSELDSVIDKLLSKNNHVSPAAISTSTSTTSIQSDSRLSTIKILVVDDHPLNRHLLIEQLNTIGFKTAAANDGIDAIEHLKNNSTDIILTDVNMPNMDGYEFTKYLRDKGYTSPIIGITANALAEEKQRCTDAGMDHCLSKPVSLAILRDTLIEYSDI